MSRHSLLRVARLLEACTGSDEDRASTEDVGYSVAVAYRNTATEASAQAVQNLLWR
jgi:hypothetical protein